MPAIALLLRLQPAAAFALPGVCRCPARPSEDADGFRRLKHNEIAFLRLACFGERAAFKASKIRVVFRYLLRVEELLVLAHARIGGSYALCRFAFARFRIAHLARAVSSGMPVDFVTAFQAPIERELVTAAFTAYDSVDEVIDHAWRGDAFAWMFR